MALFRKHPTIRPTSGQPAGRPATRNELPPGIVPMMERFGRYEFDRMNSSDSYGIFDATQAPLLDFAEQQPVAFIKALRDAVLPGGGWSAYGAARTVLNLVSPTPVEDPSFKELMDASLQFLRDNGVPPMRLNGYEWDHWIASGNTVDTWLPRRPDPTPERCPVRPLTTDEVRRVAQLTPEQDSNLVFVAEDPDGKFTALIDAKWDDDDPRRVRNPWKSAASLFDLYWDVALGLQTPPHWCDPELEPFFPLGRPKI